MNRWLKILIALIVVIAIGLIAAGLYFYNYAVVPGKKDFINENTPGSKWSRHLKARGLKMTKSTRMVNYFGRWATSKGHLFTSRQKVIVPLLWRMVIWVRQKRCLSLRKCIMIGDTMC